MAKTAIIGWLDPWRIPRGNGLALGHPEGRGGTSQSPGLHPGQAPLHPAQRAGPPVGVGGEPSGHLGSSTPDRLASHRLRQARLCGRGSPRCRSTRWSCGCSDDPLPPRFTSHLVLTLAAAATPPPSPRPASPGPVGRGPRLHPPGLCPVLPKDQTLSLLPSVLAYAISACHPPKAPGPHGHCPTRPSPSPPASGCPALGQSCSHTPPVLWPLPGPHCSPDAPGLVSPAPRCLRGAAV